jgi:hypothetical protein
VFASHWQSIVCAVAVLALQLLIFCLVFLDVVLSPEDRLNTFSIPLEVNNYVRITEVAAIVVTTLTQTEMRTALTLFYDVKDESHVIFPNLFSPHLDGASYKRWFCSAILRCVVGSLSTWVSYLLIMQDETVMSLLLNFTAIEFVSNLDDVAFILGKYGYLGMEIEHDAVTVSDTKYEIRNGRQRNARRFIPLFLAFLLMMSGWVVIFIGQRTGYFSEGTFVRKVIHLNFF